MDTRLKKKVTKLLIIVSASVFVVTFIFGAQAGPGAAFVVAAFFAGIACFSLNERRRSEGNGSRDLL